jgi:hypothetical protein
MRDICRVLGCALLLIVALPHILRGAGPPVVSVDPAGSFAVGYADYRAKIGDGVFFYASCLYVQDSETYAAYLIVPRSEKADIMLLERHDGVLGNMATIERETGNKHLDTVLNMSKLEANNGGFRITETEGGIGSNMRVSGLMDQLLVREFRIGTGEKLDWLPITGPECDPEFYHY